MPIPSKDNTKVWTHAAIIPPTSKWPKQRNHARIQEYVGSYLAVPTISGQAPDNTFNFGVIVAQANFNIPVSTALGTEMWNIDNIIYQQELLPHPFPFPWFVVIRWIDQNGNVFRYRISSDPYNLNNTGIHPYRGQLIPCNFSIEIWSDAQGTLGAFNLNLAKVFKPNDPDDYGPHAYGKLVNQIDTNTPNWGFNPANFQIPLQLNPIWAYVGN